MTQKLIVFFSAILISTTVFCQARYKSAVIGFYNLENFYDTIFHGSNDDPAFTPSGAKAYTRPVFNDKLHKLATVISQMGTAVNPDGPAILGVAELENALVLDMLTRHPLLANRGYGYVHYESKDFRGVDVALIYNPKYFKVERSRPLFVKLPEGTKDQVFTRDILWVTGLLDGERIHVFVNHWPSRAGGEKRTEPARMAAAQTIRHYIDTLQVKEADPRIFVMGDLNDDPVNKSITVGLKARGDSAKLSKDDLYNPWLSLYRRGQGTLAYQDAWSLFDQIIVSQNLLNQQQEGFFLYKNNIFKPDYIIENMGRYKGYPMRTYSGDTYRGGYSDHFPTYLVLLKRTD